MLAHRSDRTFCHYDNSSAIITHPAANPTRQPNTMYIMPGKPDAYDTIAKTPTIEQVMMMKKAKRIFMIFTP